MEQVQLAWYNALDSDQPSHYSDLSRIRQTGKYAQAVCQAIARNRPPYRLGNPRAINHTLEQLLQTGLVDKTTTGWCITDPLFRAFLLNFELPYGA